jgi:hypothetical protein
VCMPDVAAEPFCPLPISEWTWNLATPRGVEDMQMCASSGYSLSCGGAAMTFLVDALQHSGGRAVWISWPRPTHEVGKYVGTVCQDLGQLSHRQLFAIIFLSQVKIELLFVAFWSVVESCNIDYIEQRKYVLCNSLLMVPFRSILQRIVEIRSSLDTPNTLHSFSFLVRGMI